jgi:hypothetical protein
VPEPPLELVRVALAVECETGTIERMPERELMRAADVAVPLLRLNPFESSALAKLGRALTSRALGADEASAYLAASREGGPDGTPGSGAAGA